MDVEDLGNRYQQLRYRAEPTWAHLIGEYSVAPLFEDVSEEAEDAVRAEAGRIARAAATVARTPDGTAASLDAAVLAWDAATRSDVLECRFAELDVDPLFGPVAALPGRVSKLSLPSAEVARALPEKYGAFARNLRDRVERLRAGRAARRTPVSFAVRGTVDGVRAWLRTPVDDDPLLAVGALPRLVDRTALRQDLRAVVAEVVRPALNAYAGALVEQAAPSARPDERCGLCWLDDGDRTYATLVRAHTTTDLTPERIHEIGLAQVAALAEDYAVLGREIFGVADVASVLTRLREDPALHFESGDDLVRAAEHALARANDRARGWFGRIPAATCSVETATSGSLGQYFRPTKDGSRGASFVVNVSDPRAWARYEVEALAYHEGVPGHHLQMALVAELADLPEFRRTAAITGYTEGWGLYAERLADEMGLYSSALDRVGMLSFDSLRACRLVIDTGIHALGWSRDRAKRYLADNSPLSPGHIDAEVDRYIVTPGQALAYLIGRLEIVRIRADATRRQGSRFDLARFHDAVLGAGPLPLTLLDAHAAAALP
ncbi:DUF885 domain-containing protein [Jiangella muralis]|uniref:DUF885 domain-containing protein n=1 Tax=Jiangella muralis TaxID=702383 RepID=UPI00069FC7A7|nr:DUF885 domain-containing protein [Jiangella muralis]